MSIWLRACCVSCHQPWAEPLRHWDCGKGRLWRDGQAQTAQVGFKQFAALVQRGSLSQNSSSCRGRKNSCLVLVSGNFSHTSLFSNSDICREWDEIEIEYLAKGLLWMGWQAGSKRSSLVCLSWKCKSESSLLSNQFGIVLYSQELEEQEEEK